MQDTILITGGAGFIGGCFVREMIAAGQHNLVNLDLLTYAGNLDSLAPVLDNPRHTFVQGDVRDAGLVGSLLEKYRPSAIVHFAAESHVDRSIGSPGEFIQTNIVGTFTLINAAFAYWEGLKDNDRDQFRFLHVSTDEVYGSLGATGKFTETTPYAPNSPYSASKAASDHLARAYFHTYGLPVLISNCSNNYGSHQFPEKLIPLIILNALEGKRLPIYGDGTNVRDWLHVEDHCDALRTVLSKGRPGEVYNIGGDSEKTNLEVVHAICETVDRLRPDLSHAPCKSLIEFVTDRPGHDRRYAIDASKIKNELGWSPRHNFEEGIEETVRWYLDNQQWVERVTSGSYQRERLGLPGESQSAQTQLVPKSRPAETYTEGEIDGAVFKPLGKFEDHRGWLLELFRGDELPVECQPVMCYVSQTNPGVVRGPHEHVEQTDYFAFVGPGDFKLYLWDSRPDSPTFGKKLVRVCGESAPCSVIVPPGVVHAYRNTSSGSGWVFNAPNQLYAGYGKKSPVDEIRHEDVDGSPYQIVD